MPTLDFNVYNKVRIPTQAVRRDVRRGGGGEGELSLVLCRIFPLAVLSLLTILHFVSYLLAFLFRCVARWKKIKFSTHFSVRRNKRTRSDGIFYAALVDGVPLTKRSIK